MQGCLDRRCLLLCDPSKNRPRFEKLCSAPNALMTYNVSGRVYISNKCYLLQSAQLHVLDPAHASTAIIAKFTVGSVI